MSTRGWSLLDKQKQTFGKTDRAIDPASGSLSQFSVGVLFDYRGREHALMVLIDHLLGGGIKDCWVAQGRPAKEMRNTVAASRASEPSTFFEDIDADDVAGLLGLALTHSSCPEQDDQIEDVAGHLYLVRARVEHVAQLAGVTPVERA